MNRGINNSLVQICRALSLGIAVVTGCTSLDSRIDIPTHYVVRPQESAFSLDDFKSALGLQWYRLSEEARNQAIEYWNSSSEHEKTEAYKIYANSQRYYDSLSPGERIMMDERMDSLSPAAERYFSSKYPWVDFQRLTNADKLFLDYTLEKQSESFKNRVIPIDTLRYIV